MEAVHAVDDAVCAHVVEAPLEELRLEVPAIGSRVTSCRGGAPCATTRVQICGHALAVAGRALREQGCPAGEVCFELGALACCAPLC